MTKNSTNKEQGIVEPSELVALQTVFKIQFLGNFVINI